MRKKIYNALILIVVLHCYSSHLTAQGSEVFLGLGSSHYTGDLSPVGNKDPFPLRRHVSLTGGYRYHFKKFFSFGIELSKLKISADDGDNTSSVKYDQGWYRKIRNLNFSSDIYQVFGEIRFEPLLNPDRWYSENLFVSPYIGAGIGLFIHNPMTTYNGQAVSLSTLQTEGVRYSLTQVCVPVTVGIRVTGPNRRITTSINFQYFLTTTEYLDDVSTNYVDPNTFFARFDPVTATMAADLANRSTVKNSSEGYITAPGQQRGNPKNNDSYFNTTITMSLHFGGPRRDGYRKCCYYF